MGERLGITAREAAELTGYHSVHQFRRAVADGVMPKPFESRTRPHLWSVAALERACDGAAPGARVDPDAETLDRRLGLI